MPTKYGFIYIWRDRKHRRFYIGSHWGNIDDGYICSSKWMKDSYKRRPHDFKRRILKVILTDKADLIKEEYRILNLIKKDEFDGGVYNIGNEKNVISIKDLAAKVIAISGSNSKVVYKEFKSIYGSETGEILQRVPNTKKINSLYSSVIDIDTCIKKMLSSGS